jgi:hypothetical protein
MHLVITGLNAWSIVFLLAALLGGLLGRPWHPTVGLLASILSVLAQSAVFALFIGAAKTLKETVRAYRLPASFIDRANRIYFRLFPWATAAALVTVVAATLGGLAGRSTALFWIHGLLSAAALVVNAAAAIFEHRELKDMHFVLCDMAAAVPPGAERPLPAAPAPGARPAGPSDRRPLGKAILTLSGLALATLLGYRVIAGAPLPDLVVACLAAPCLACAGLGLYYLARGARRAGPP